MPDVGTVNRYGMTWDGTRWQPPGQTAVGGGKGGGPGVVPATNRAAPPPSSGGITRHDILKEFLMTGGMVAGGMLAPEIPLVAGLAEASPWFARLLRIGGAGAGGATGRMAGHVPEAAVEATTGKPSGSTFVDEATRGAIEGTVGEAAPMVAAPVLKYGGKGLRAVGRFMGDSPTMAPWQRGAASVARGITARELGLPGTVQAAASAGPIAATELGTRAERAGEWLGPATTSERVQRGLEWLKQKFLPAPVPTRAATMADALTDYERGLFGPTGRRPAAAQARAEAATAAARGEASGLPLDLGERVTVTTQPVRSQPEVSELPVWREPPPPPRPVITPAPAPAPPVRTGTGFSTTDLPAGGQGTFGPRPVVVRPTPAPTPTRRPAGTGTGFATGDLPPGGQGTFSQPTMTRAQKDAATNVRQATGAAPKTTTPKTTPKTAAPSTAAASSGSTLDDLIASAEAQGVPVDPELYAARDAANAAAGKPAAAPTKARGNPNRGAGGRFGTK